jgi:hypothetical protein
MGDRSSNLATVGTVYNTFSWPLNVVIVIYFNAIEMRLGM